MMPGNDFFVNIWSETITLPTYEVGEADIFPHFLEKRVYQGASGAVYPYRVIEHIKDDITDKEYNAIYLENPYIKIMVLPELGGRVHMAWDKIAERHFVYYNQVIKPALVGLIGPWISGGIEFNWPQHHRPSTYLPISWDIVENDDGSKTLWVCENERMYGLTGMAGFTLYPDAALLEIKGRVFNGTNMPQTFLWWANPAIKAGDGHQSIFPADVTAVFDHGKRDVSTFPIATGEYYKVDYSEGVDISRYKNIPVPTSYMAWKSKYNFVGVYDHEEQAGLLHVADYQISPGKKQWTWGNGAFGKAWDRNLTDEDGPYIELMTGVFTDNQPDFAWLNPYEEKSFTQVFMPYQKLGEISNASKDIVLRCTFDNNHADIHIYATKMLKKWVLQLVTDTTIIAQEYFNASPENIWNKKIELPSNVQPKDIRIIIKDDVNQTNLTWSLHRPDKKKALPDVAKAPLPPKKVKHMEELWLIGMHILQYHHGTANPMDYWQEALRRDAFDYRSNLAVARYYMGQGRYKKALSHLKKAKKRATMLNDNPYDGEVFFLLGLVYESLGKYKKSYDSYYKAVWNEQWADKAFFALASLKVQKGHYIKAWEFIQQSISHNGLNEKAKHLSIVILRLNAQKQEAILQAKTVLKDHPFATAVLYELYLLTEDEQYLHRLLHLSANSAHNHMELSLDYMRIKDYAQALRLVEICDDTDDPMLYYYQSYYQAYLNDDQKATASLTRADDIKTPKYFPNRVKDILVLKSAIHRGSLRAEALLGCFFYSKKAYKKALKLWHDAVEKGVQDSVVLRNLAIASYNKENNPKKALHLMENAFEKDHNNSRLFLELDQLYQVLKKSPSERLHIFEQHMDNVYHRDDLFIEYIKLLNLSKQYDKALRYLKKRKFHPWEGGEGRVSAQWIISHIMLSQRAFKEKDYQTSIKLLQNAMDYPDNLGEGKLAGTTDNEILYLLGLSYQKMGQEDEAKKCFAQASETKVDLDVNRYYNDQPADYILFQGLSKVQLKEHKAANKCFDRLISFAKKHRNKTAEYDFFAVSLPNLFVFDQDIQMAHNSYCDMIMGLGHIGKSNKKKAIHYLQKSLKIDPDNSRIFLMMELLENSDLILSY